MTACPRTYKLGEVVDGKEILILVDMFVGGIGRVVMGDVLAVFRFCCGCVEMSLCLMMAPESELKKLTTI